MPCWESHPRLPFRSILVTDSDPSWTPVPTSPAKSSSFTSESLSTFDRNHCPPSVGTGVQNPSARSAEWREEELATINDRYNDRYWLANGAPVACPSCGATVSVKVSKRAGFPKHIVAFCQGCGRRAGFKSSAVEGPPFAEEQTRDFVGIHLHGGSIFCPHDGSLLKVSSRAAMGRVARSYFVECPRCGGFGEISWVPNDTR